MQYKYPYTDLYNLNLDWMIKAIQEVQQVIVDLGNVVNTFNGESGDVTLTGDDITTLLGSVVKSVNGMTGNVTLTESFILSLLGTVVKSFNGRDGAVTLQAADVNALDIDIVWESDSGESISDLTQDDIDEIYASGKRLLIFVNNLGVPDTMYYLMIIDNTVTPTQFQPTSENSGVLTFNTRSGAVTLQTTDVVNVATGSDLHTASDDTTSIASTIATIKSAILALQSGTVKDITYNGQKLKASWDGETYADIMTVDHTPADGSTNPITSDAVYDGLSSLNSQKANEESIGLRRSGSTNSGAQIDNGTYFYLDGVLKHAIDTIANGATFTSSNCETVPVGAINNLVNNIIKYRKAIPITTLSAADDTYTAPCSGFIYIQCVKDNDNAASDLRMDVNNYNALRYTVNNTTVAYMSQLIPVSKGDIVAIKAATNMYNLNDGDHIVLYPNS